MIYSVVGCPARAWRFDCAGHGQCAGANAVGPAAPSSLRRGPWERKRLAEREYRMGLRTRILGGDANWMLAMIRGDPLPPGQKRLSKASAVARFLWNCGPWTRDDTFWWRDPKPFWVDLRSMARRLRERSVDLIGNPENRQDMP